MSRNSDEAQRNDDTSGALFSANGRFVAFTSRSGKSGAARDEAGGRRIRRDLEEGTTERLAADDISDDQPFDFEVAATAITPDADGGSVADTRVRRILSTQRDRRPQVATAD